MFICHVDRLFEIVVTIKSIIKRSQNVTHVLSFENETIIIILINYLEKFRNHPKKNDCDQSINCGKKNKIHSRIVHL